MKEIITMSGAVIHVDPDDQGQMQMLPVALAAFGGSLFEFDPEPIAL